MYRPLDVMRDECCEGRTKRKKEGGAGREGEKADANGCETVGGRKRHDTGRGR